MIFFSFYLKNNPRYFEENFLRKNVFEIIDYKNIKFSELRSSVSLATHTRPPEVRSQEAEAGHGPLQEWDGWAKRVLEANRLVCLACSVVNSTKPCPKGEGEDQPTGYPLTSVPVEIPHSQESTHMHTYMYTRLSKGVYRLNECLAKFKLLFFCCF